MWQHFSVSPFWKFLPTFLRRPWRQFRDQYQNWLRQCLGPAGWWTGRGGSRCTFEEEIFTWSKSNDFTCATTNHCFQLQDLLLFFNSHNEMQTGAGWDYYLIFSYSSCTILCLPSDTTLRKCLSSETGMNYVILIKWYNLKEMSIKWNTPIFEHVKTLNFDQV